VNKISENAIQKAVLISSPFLSNFRETPHSEKRNFAKP